MQIKIIEEKENPLLKRKDIKLSVDYNGESTPSRAKLQKKLSEELGVNAEHIEINKLLSETGMPKGKAWIHVWKEKKVDVIIDKKSQSEAAQPAEKPAEEKKEEKVEAKQVEQPAEEKAESEETTENKEGEE